MSEDLRARLEEVLDECGWPKATLPFFGGGTVQLAETVFAPGPATFIALREAADSEFPNVIDLDPPCPQS